MMNTDLDPPSASCYKKNLTDFNSNALFKTLNTSFENDHYHGSDPIYVDQ